MRFEADDFQGLTPSVDARKSEKLFALGGRNYVFDSFGPAQCFGNRFSLLILSVLLSGPRGCASDSRLAIMSLYSQAIAVLEWSESLGGWRVLYYFTANLRAHPYRWTWGYLSGIMFFCHPASESSRTKLL
jgi:hypothetical protein